MRNSLSTLHAFAEAFNRRDLAGASALLAPDATAEVLDSGFPEERGREVIECTSLPYLLDPAALLVASVVLAEGDPWVLLRSDDGSGPIDTAIRARIRQGKILRLEYLVAPHQPEALRAVGLACGLPTAADDGPPTP